MKTQVHLNIRVERPNSQMGHKGSLEFTGDSRWFTGLLRAIWSLTLHPGWHPAGLLHPEVQTCMGKTCQKYDV